MDRKILHAMTPAQKQQRQKELLRRETVLDEEQRIVAALIQLISNEGLTGRKGRMTARQVQVLFKDESDQTISAQAMIRVLTKIGVERDRSGWVQPREIMESTEIWMHWTPGCRRPSADAEKTWGDRSAQSVCRPGPSPDSPRERKQKHLAPG